jgi:hypothetical protein
LQNVGLLSAKQAFNVNKGLSIAQGTMNSFEAYTSTLANSPFPPPFNFVAAGAALAAGLAKVAVIASTKFNPQGGGSAPSAGGGSSSFTLPSRPSFTSDMSQRVANEPASRTTNFQPIVNLQVENRLDREGLALNVREGNDTLNARAISVRGTTV